ncbi:cell wall metabolism sensor histidine kinase WalK [Clostridium gasigenes]|uniref:ATP-binding protein n=1 Tax=Clostridium gasigenes TaxID=94869 RepID=UPI001C0D5B80|nr:ATP-binding protein [Clostridium gasigenes]MBU3134124.1 cell wall metabolism sensor histidine kinase WalK [Clostridium gasigenes]
MIKSIKSKIFLILIVFLVLTIGNTLVSINYFNKLQQSIDLIMHANYDSVVAAQNMIESLERQDSLELAFIFEKDSLLSKVHEENHMKFLEWLYIAKGNITETGEKEILAEIEKTYMDYSKTVQVLESLKVKDGVDSVRIYYYNDVFHLFEKLKNNCSDLLDINQQSMVNKKEESKELANKASYYTLSILALVLFVGLCIIGYLLKKIIRPIEDLAVGIKMVSQGNYDYEIPLKRDKEINFVLEDFNHMVKELKKYETLNINEILREKQKAEAIVESINSPIIVTNSENKVTMVNKASERILDVKEKNVINRHFLEVIERRDIFDMIQKSKNSIKESKAFEDIEIIQRDEKRYYRITANPIWFDHSENIGTVTIMQDITKFKEVENLKSEFVSTVSHEFRTPLTSISMAIGLLLENSFDNKEEENELLTIIKDDSERLNNLVGELLDISKMESGKIEMEIQEVDINEVIKPVNNAFKMQLEEKKVGLSIDTNGISRKIKVDINKISWVLINLVSNALRYIASDGTGKIVIRANEVNSDMLISIADNGKGISGDDQTRIFEKFVQLKNDDGEVNGSSGLGLAICKEIVKAHCGDIWVDSVLGEGSTFYFTLKLGGIIDEEKNTNS